MARSAKLQIVTSDVATVNPSSVLSTSFPDVDPGVRPFGHRVLVQIRGAKKKTSGGIILPEESQDTEKWNTQVARVVSVASVAFKNRETLAEWPEGAWCKPGMFVRVPKYGGDRWEVKFDAGTALFVIFNDTDIIGQITGDPLAIKAFL